MATRLSLSGARKSLTELDSVDQQCCLQTPVLAVSAIAGIGRPFGTMLDIRILNPITPSLKWWRKYQTVTWISSLTFSAVAASARPLFQECFFGNAADFSDASRGERSLCLPAWLSLAPRCSPLVASSDVPVLAGEPLAHPTEQLQRWRSGPGCPAIWKPLPCQK